MIQPIPNGGGSSSPFLILVVLRKHPCSSLVTHHIFYSPDAVFWIVAAFYLQIRITLEVMYMTDEQALIEQARGDPQAFRELYRRYITRVYAYVVYRVRRTQDAEDIVAEVFLKVVNGLPGFTWRGDGAFAAWVFRIASNEVSRFYRQHQPATEPLPLDDLPDIRADGLAPDQAVMRKEQFAHLSTLIATLPARRREIITLKFFGGLRNHEIAAVLELDERTVASHLSRALDDLRRHYASERENER